MIVTGIGSRETPERYLSLFEDFGAYARENGWWVRTGHGVGGDYAFERGALDASVVYLPWRGFNGGFDVLGRSYYEHELRADVMEVVYRHEPYLMDLDVSARKLRGLRLLKQRSVFEVLGVNMDSPSDVLVCWTEGGGAVGGSGLAIKVAEESGIPVINLGLEPELDLSSLIEAVVWSGGVGDFVRV